MNGGGGGVSGCQICKIGFAVDNLRLLLSLEILARVPPPSVHARATYGCQLSFSWRLRRMGISHEDEHAPPRIALMLVEVNLLLYSIWGLA